MTGEPETRSAREGRIPFALALTITLAMAIAYTAIDVIQPQEPAQAVLALLPGTLAIAALSVATVVFLAGCGWGRQVQRDSTVVWAMVQHGAFLAVMSMFDWG